MYCTHCKYYWIMPDFTNLRPSQTNTLNMTTSSLCSSRIHSHPVSIQKRTFGIWWNRTFVSWMHSSRIYRGRTLPLWNKIWGLFLAHLICFSISIGCWGPCFKSWFKRQIVNYWLNMFPLVKWQINSYSPIFPRTQQHHLTILLFQSWLCVFFRWKPCCLRRHCVS